MRATGVVIGQPRVFRPKDSRMWASILGSPSNSLCPSRIDLRHVSLPSREGTAASNTTRPPSSSGVADRNFGDGHSRAAIARTA
jgi:hypothetical protein